MITCLALLNTIVKFARYNAIQTAYDPYCTTSDNPQALSVQGEYKTSDMVVSLSLCNGRGVPPIFSKQQRR